MNFCHTWFLRHKHVLERTPFVDPRSKFSYFGVDPKRSNSWVRAFCTIGDNITNKRIPFRCRIQGVVKKFNDYCFYSVNNNAKLQVRTFNFSKINLSTYLKGTTLSNFKNKGLPLPLSSVSKIVGVFKGSLPFKVDNRSYFEDTKVLKAFKDVPEYLPYSLERKEVFR